MSWFDVLKEEDSSNLNSLKEKQKYRLKLYERERLNSPTSFFQSDEPFWGFRFYGALEIFSILGKKFERKAYKWLSRTVFRGRGEFLLYKINEAELKEKPVIELNPRLYGSGRPNEVGEIILTLSFAGPNMEVGGHHIDIPVEEFMNIYPSGYKDYKINNTVERGDYKRVLNYLLENMDDSLSALEVPFEILPKDTQKYIKYRKYSSIYVKIAKFTNFAERTNFVDKWTKMLKGGFRF